MKYEILKDEFIEFDDRKLYRIKALKDFHNVKEGEFGGYIESERNLSHEGDAWVYSNAQVSGDARVYGNAQVSGDARVSGDAWVCGDAQVCGDAWVCGDAQVCGDAWVSGNARVSDNARVCGNARVYSDARVCGNARVYSDARVCGDAWVSGSNAVVWFSNVGTENGTLTVYCGKNGLIATRGCFTGSVEEFLAKSAEVHDEKTKREYELLIEVARSRLEEAQGNIGSE